MAMVTVPQLTDLPVGSLIAAAGWGAVKTARHGQPPVWRITGSHAELSDVQMARAVHNAIEHGTLPGPRPGEVVAYRHGSQPVTLTGETLRRIVDAARELAWQRERLVARRPHDQTAEECRAAWAQRMPATAWLVDFIDGDVTADPAVTR